MSNGIVRAYGKEVDRSRVSEVKEYSGKGVCATLDGHRVLVGNARFMSDNGIDIGSVNITSSSVYVALDSEYAGVIAFSDEVKDGVAEALAELSRLGVKKTVMLTGDSDASARRVASELGITEYKSGLLPQDKLCELEALIEKSRGNVMFTGDGINDSPVLSRADIGVSMGALGSDAAIEASDVVIMDDDIRKLPRAIKISRKCIRIVYQNIIFAIGIKLVCLVLGAVGLASMNAAIFADVGVMVLAVLNAMRALRTGK